MSFTELLQQFSQILGLPALQSDSKGYFSIQSENLAIKCFHAAGQVYLLGELAELPASEEEKLDSITKMLQVCLINLKNCRESICIDEEQSTLQLFRQKPLEQLNAQSLIDMASDFFDTLEYLTQYCNAEPASTYVHNTIRA